MKPKLPHEYIVSVDRISAAVATVAAPPRPTFVGGPPPEFQGDAHVWSPEHLLAAALGLCLFTTFEAFAAREHLEVHGYRDVATAVLDRTSSGLAFKSFTICVELTVAPADVERASAILERAKQNCIISRALVVAVKIEPHIWSHDAREHASCVAQVSNGSSSVPTA